MNLHTFWTEHFNHSDQALYNRFIALRPSDCNEVLEQLGVPRVQGVKFESPENRVFGFGDIVIKFYRPERWSLSALQDEVDFLEDIRDAQLPFVKPIGEIGTWQGIHYLAFERIPAPFETDPKILSEDKVRKMVHTTAKLHQVGAQRPAKARPEFNLRAMCEGSLEAIIRFGYLPKTLISRYQAAIEKLATLTEEFGDIPCQRIHGDSYSGNALWRPDGPVMLDLDDFQMGPIAVDMPLLSFPWRLDSLPESMSRKERRKVQHQLVISLYKEIKNYDEDQESLIPLVRGCRNVTFDAWMSARWNEPGFNEQYEDDDLCSEQWWTESIEEVEKACKNHTQGWL